MFGSQEIQKLMYKDKLVYQNALPKGTVFLENYTVKARENIINLPMISSDWSNITSSIRFNWFDLGNDMSTVFTKDDLLSGVKVIRINNQLAMTLSRKSNTLVINSQANGYLIKKIYLV